MDTLYRSRGREVQVKIIRKQKMNKNYMVIMPHCVELNKNQKGERHNSAKKIKLNITVLCKV